MPTLFTKSKDELKELQGCAIAEQSAQTGEAAVKWLERVNDLVARAVALKGTAVSGPSDSLCSLCMYALVSAMGAGLWVGTERVLVVNQCLTSRSSS